MDVNSVRLRVADNWTFCIVQYSTVEYSVVISGVWVVGLPMRGKKMSSDDNSRSRYYTEPSAQLQVSPDHQPIVSCFIKGQR